jgi:hypothetical protein
MTMSSAIGRAMLVAVFVSVGALSAMAGDGPTTVAPATAPPTSAADGEKVKVVVDQSSAKATMETMARAFKARDGGAIAGCLPPEYKDSMGQMIVAMTDMLAKSDSLKKTVEAKFGKEAADAALKGSPADSMTKGGPFGEDGAIDWAKVKLTEDGDTATVQEEGKGSKESLKKINGKWYMSPPEGMTPEKAKKDSEQGCKMMKAMADAMVEIEKQVKDSKVGKDDLQKALGDIMMKVMTEAMKDAAPN